MKRIIEIENTVFNEFKNGVNSMQNDCIISNAVFDSKPYDDSGDLISREALLNEFDTKCQSMCPACEYHKWNSKLKRYECELIYTAPPVEPRIEYGTDGQPYKLSMTNGKEYERPQGEWIEFESGYRCSNCDDIEVYTPNFCPHCGAKMKGRFVE